MADIKSYRIKRNDGKYYRVAFSIYNFIKKIDFVSDERDATLFQHDWIIKGDGSIMTGDLPIGKIRCTAINEYFHVSGINQEEYTVEDLMAPEQELELIAP